MCVCVCVADSDAVSLWDIDGKLELLVDSAGTLNVGKRRFSGREACHLCLLG